MGSVCVLIIKVATIIVCGAAHEPYRNGEQLDAVFSGVT